MHHHRPLARPVLGYVFELEPLRELKVDLDRGVRELAAVGVLHLEVDLRAVERGIPHTDLIGLPHRRERFCERVLCAHPLLLGPEPFLFHVVARREAV